MPTTSPTPLAAKAPATTRSCQMSPSCGKDRRDAGAGGPAAARQLGPAPRHGAVPDQDAGHVGDGVEGAGRQRADGDAQILARARRGPAAGSDWATRLLQASRRGGP